jgi:hypothetical protein
VTASGTLPPCPAQGLCETKTEGEAKRIGHWAEMERRRLKTTGGAFFLIMHPGMIAKFHFPAAIRFMHVPGRFDISIYFINAIAINSYKPFDMQTSDLDTKRSRSGWRFRAFLISYVFIR